MSLRQRDDGFGHQPGSSTKTHKVTYSWWPATCSRGPIFANTKAHIRDLYPLPGSTNPAPESDAMTRLRSALRRWASDFRRRPPPLRRSLPSSSIESGRLNRKDQAFLWNDVMVCLFATDIYHCLKQRSTSNLDLVQKGYRGRSGALSLNLR